MKTPPQKSWLRRIFSWPKNIFTGVVIGGAINSVVGMLVKPQKPAAKPSDQKDSDPTSARS